MTSKRDKFARCHRGFSLVEALLAMGLVLALLGMISTLMREYTAVSRHTAARDNTFDGVQYALTEMAQELGSAIKFVTPTTSSPSTSLRFFRLNPNLDRFPPIEDLPVNDDDQPIWEPHPTTSLWDVQYFKEASSGALIRQVSSLGGSTVSNRGTGKHVMVAKIDGLKVSRLSDDYYKVELTFVEDKRPRTYSRIGRAWCRP